MEATMIDEATLVEEEMTSETHAAKWARPHLEPFDARETTITFQAGKLCLKLKEK